MSPRWARLLTDDDEWTVRTALANVASDLQSVADEVGEGQTRDALELSVARYRTVLDRIEHA